MDSVTLVKGAMALGTVGAVIVAVIVWIRARRLAQQEQACLQEADEENQPLWKEVQKLIAICVRKHDECQQKLESIRDSWPGIHGGQNQKFQRARPDLVFIRAELEDTLAPGLGVIEGSVETQRFLKNCTEQLPALCNTFEEITADCTQEKIEEAQGDCLLLAIELPYFLNLAELVIFESQTTEQTTESTRNTLKEAQELYQKARKMMRPPGSELDWFDLRERLQEVDALVKCAIGNVVLDENRAKRDQALQQLKEEA